MEIQAVKGTKDILPNEINIWRAIETEAKKICANFAYQEIRTPLLEEERLFSRSIGESSDIVRKEMYTFLDRKERRLCLRPEGTASVVRAYLEHGLDKDASIAKFFYFGPMFRAERPQAGRLRQFHHLGVEAIGADSPYLDIEVISLAVTIIEKIGLKGYALQINSIGCPEDRQRYKLVLENLLKPKLKFLCPDCHSRYKINLLRIFDCKNLECKKIVEQLPHIIDSLCEGCLQHFKCVQDGLKNLDIKYEISPYLVRGLDYYTRTCFEIISPHLGAQNALGAGGRYDNLVSDLGGPSRPAIGFALGIERLITALSAEKEKINVCFAEEPLQLFICTLGEKAKQAVFPLVYSLRKAGISCEINYQDKSLKGQMRLADKLGAVSAAILGEDELRKGVIIVRDMRTKEQKEVPLINLNMLMTELKK
ncbi:MAG: histidine--tRNA ligase [Candidatus Omnitrophota bacterium]